jgi:hypothetical protein
VRQTLEIFNWKNTIEEATIEQINYLARED